MKTRKTCRILAMILILALAMGVFPVLDAKADVPKVERLKTENTTFSSNSLKFVVTDSDEVSVKGLEGSATEIRIPSEVSFDGKTYDVVSVMKNAFKNNSKLKKVTIDADLDSIGEKAFYGCKALEKLIINGDVYQIGNKSFYKCKKLKRITVSTDAIEKIGKKAFSVISARAEIIVPSDLMASYKELFKKAGCPSKVKFIENKPEDKNKPEEKTTFVPKTVRLEELTSVLNTPRKAGILTDNYGNGYGSAFVNDNGYSGSEGAFGYQYLVKGEYNRFRGTLYIPQGEKSEAHAVLTVKGDGYILYTSPIMNKTSKPVDIDVDITGYDAITILWGANCTYNSISNLKCCLANACFCTVEKNENVVDKTKMPISLIDFKSIYSTVAGGYSGIVDNYGNEYGSYIYNRIDNYHGNQTPVFEYLFDGKYSRFQCTLCVAAGYTFTVPVKMMVYADGNEIYVSPEMNSTSAPVNVDIDLSGCNDVKITFTTKDKRLTGKSEPRLCLGNPYLFIG